jgi:hygromycin-B 4-O-kinase
MAESDPSTEQYGFSQHQAEAQSFVTARYGRRAARLRLIGAGEWSQAYAFTLDGQESVIRFGRYGEDFLKDRVMAAYTTADLPVPAVRETGRAADGYFAVSDRAPGRLLNDLDEAAMRTALPGLLRALDTLRAVEIPGGSGYGIWAPDGTATAATWPQALLAVSQETTRVPGWRAALATSPTGPSAFRAGYARLQELVTGLPQSRHVIHGDLVNRNVLAEGTRITAVIDWGNALYGDYLYDAAWLIYWWPWFPAWQDIDIAGDLRRHWDSTGGTPADLEYRLLTYLIHIGLDAMSYDAFKHRPDDLARNATQVLELARISPLI